MPRSRQRSPIFFKSATCVRGLAIVSTNTARVAGVSAASTWRTSVASTNVTGWPCASSVSSALVVLPNTNWLATMWSPRFSSARKIAPMAAMPVANVIVPTPPSIALTLASSAVDVGLPWRP